MFGVARTHRYVALAMAAASIASSCSGSIPRSAPPATSAAPAPAPSTRPEDERLRVGILLPRSGAGATFGAPLEAAVHMAADEINAAGGVNGKPLELEIRDVGSDASTAAVAVGDLLNDHVDAIVGPASSRNELALLGRIVEAGVVSCSPTATAISLSQFPSHGLFFRTIPSDALQANAMADIILQSGRNSTAIFYPSDDYGKEFFAKLNSALATHSITVTPAPYDPSAADLSGPAMAALASNTGVLTVIGDAAGGTHVLSALRALTTQDPSLVRPIVVNDALRRADVVGAVGISGALLRQITGTSPDSEPVDATFAKKFASNAPGLPSTYAAYAYDCLNLIALAARAAHSDVPTNIARAVQDVSRSGTPCSTYADCSTQLAQGRNVDYVGASGPVDLDQNGDVTSGLFEQFDFDATGRDVTLSELAV